MTDSWAIMKLSRDLLACETDEQFLTTARAILAEAEENATGSASCLRCHQYRHAPMPPLSPPEPDDSPYGLLLALTPFPDLHRLTCWEFGKGPFDPGSTIAWVGRGWKDREEISGD